MRRTSAAVRVWHARFGGARAWKRAFGTIPMDQPVFAANNEVRSPYPDVPIDVPPGGSAPFVVNRFKRYGETPAVTDCLQNVTRTYAQLHSMVCTTAQNLQALHGFKQGDVLALYSPNDVDYVVALQATAALGGVVTPINPLYQGQDLRHQLVNSKASVIVAHPLVVEHAKEAAAECGIEHVFVLGDMAPEGTASFSALASGTVDTLPDVTVDPEDTVYLPYSSGTTGNPKGVMLTHRNIVCNLRQIEPGETENYSPGDAFFCPLPFFHIYGLMVGLNACVREGVHLVTGPRFDFGRFLSSIPEFQIKRAHLVPPIIVALAKEPVVDKFDLSSLEVIMSAAAPLGSDLQVAAADRLGCKIKQAWGMTETSPAGTLTNDNKITPGLATTGPLVPNSRAVIVDPATNEVVPPTSSGELWLAGPHIMKGYFMNDEANARDLVELNGTTFFKTGDIAYFDEDGQLFITDRIKELIKYKGFQVPPAELEDLLLTHPAIKDAAVVGILDDQAGELPRAVVVLKPDASATEEEIAQFVADQVAPHKKLRGGVVLAQEIPKTASGKILRRVLRDEFNK